MQRFPFTLARLGILLGAAGFVGIALGWDGASRQVHVEAQIPYVISGGLGGLALVIVGTGLLLAHALLGRGATAAPPAREQVAVEPVPAPGAEAGAEPAPFRPLPRDADETTELVPARKRR